MSVPSVFVGSAARPPAFTPRYSLPPATLPVTCHPMPKNNARAVQHHRGRLRARGLRPVQLWLPDTRTPAFAAQVAHDIAAVAQLSAEDDAMMDAFERLAAEDLGERP